MEPDEEESLLTWKESQSVKLVVLKTLTWLPETAERRLLLRAGKLWWAGCWGLREVVQRVVMERFKGSGGSFWREGTDGRVEMERLLSRLV